MFRPTAPSRGQLHARGASLKAVCYRVHKPNFNLMTYVRVWIQPASYSFFSQTFYR